MKGEATVLIALLAGCSESDSQSDRTYITSTATLSQLRYAGQFENYYEGKAIGTLKCIVEKGPNCRAAKPSISIGEGEGDMMFEGGRWTPDFLTKMQKDFQSYRFYEIGPEASVMDVPSEFRIQPGARRLTQEIIDSASTKVTIELIKERDELRREVSFRFKNGDLTSMYLSKTSYSTGRI